MTSLITGTRLLLAGSSAASQPAISTAPGCGGSPELLAAPTVSSRSIRCAPRAPGRISAGASRRSPGLPPVQHLDPERVAERARTTQSQLGLSENGVNVKYRPLKSACAAAPRGWLPLWPLSLVSSSAFVLMFSPGVPPPAALGGVSYRTRRSFCRIRFDLTPRGLRLKKTHFHGSESSRTGTVPCRITPAFCPNQQVSARFRF